MPTRFLKESICTSEQIAALSPQAEVLFYRLITKVDDFGRYYANPKIIAGQCFPLIQPKDSQVVAWLAELCKVGLVEVYPDLEGKQYLKLVSWEKHQKPRARVSKFPPPPLSESTRAQMQTNANDCTQTQTDVNTCGQMQTDADKCARYPYPYPYPISDIRNSISVSDIRSTPSAQDAHFNEFWAIYPRKAGKKDAQAVWAKLKPDAELHAQIITAVQQAKGSRQWQKDNGQFIPNPATWLRQGRWEDEHEKGEPRNERAKPEAGGFDWPSIVAAQKLRREREAAEECESAQRKTMS